ncbi:MAG: NUDIX domain-containing protein [Terrimicrobiaceae bacterium]|nr:NUDIX domain-containing protein [Terrimicrobiaceae bacterium]
MIRYRPNVAFILRRADGRVLAGERSDLSGAWQFPQGGVNAGESLEAALAREVLEEISLPPADYRVVEKRGPYRYTFPDGRTKEGCGGQEQTYFLADLLGDEKAILRDPSTMEFQAVRWFKPASFPIGTVAPMKRAVYREVLRDFFGVEPAAGRESS